MRELLLTVIALPIRQVSITMTAPVLMRRLQGLMMFMWQLARQSTQLCTRAHKHT
jgi:hypothetical protein